MQYNYNAGGASAGNAYVQSPVALPPGWQAAMTPEGATYYIDHNTRTTHWTLPAQASLPQYGANNTGNYNAASQGGNRGAYGGGYGGRGGGGAYGGNGYNRQRRGIDRTKMKTKMCMNMTNSGTCSFGENCAFAHSSEELAAQPRYNNNNNNNNNNANNNNNNGASSNAQGPQRQSPGAASQ